jgi:hypothetical protein
MIAAPTRNKRAGQERAAIVRQPMLRPIGSNQDNDTSEPNPEPMVVAHTMSPIVWARFSGAARSAAAYRVARFAACPPRCPRPRVAGAGKKPVMAARTALNAPAAPRNSRGVDRVGVGTGHDAASGNDAIADPIDRHAAESPARVLLPVRSSARSAVTE